VIGVEKGWGYAVDRDDLKMFFQNNPGVHLCFLDTLFVDALTEIERVKRRKMSMEYGFQF